MTELPGGTVTFLFTDIEGSTMRLKELGAERYSDVLERHNELLRAAFATYGGVEVESLGDGFFVVFQTADAALDAVVDSQQAFAAEPWPTQTPIGIRMGLHTGEALVRGGTYVGYAVHHAARIGDMGHGGQTLLSEATAALVERDLPAAVRLRSLGEVAIADADRPQRLFQLEIEGLRVDFPPLRVKQRRVLTPEPDRLVERADELAMLGELVDAAHAGSGRFGLIVGDAGIGKTTLVSEVRLTAELRGMQVLQARGGELEHDFSYGIVRQLFESRLATASVDERREMLAGSAAIADQLFEEVASPAMDFGPVDTSFALLHGLYWLTANLASEQPALVLIDDLQWADEPSLRWLGYLVRRLEGLPVLVVVALRPPEQGFEKVLLTELVSDPAARLILPKALSHAAVEALVRSVLSAEADEEFSRACFEATGGNPLFVRALLDALASEKVPPRAEYAEAVMEIGPQAVSRAVELRLARLPSEAAALARAAAVLGEDSELAVVAALAELDQDVAAHAATALARSTILRFAGTLGFVHPVVRAALYAELTQPERAREHLRAARVLSEHRAPAERVAAQLLLAPPSGDHFAIDALTEAADASLRRGDPRGAARYLRRALDESPDERTVQCELYMRLGRAERLLSSPGAAEPLRRAYELAETPDQRAQIARELGTALFYGQHVEEAIAVFQEAIAELDEEHVELRRLLEGALLSVTSIFPPLYPIAQLQKERIAALGLGDDIGSRMINSILSYDDARRLAPYEQAVERAEQALAAGPLHSEDNAAYIFAVYTFALVDRFADAEAVWHQAWVDAQARGSISGYALVSTFRAFVELHTGRLDEALTDASNGLQACQEYGFVTGIPYAVAHIADAALELGDVEVARTAVEQLDAVGDGSHLVWAFLDSRGRTRIAHGDTRAGLEDVLEAGRQYAVLDGRNPALLAWRSTAALAHFELGEHDDALRLAREEVELAREWSRPRAIGQALRVAGMVEPDRGVGLALLREAVAVLDGSPARPARAKALIELGVALRAAGENGAEDALLDGLELARAMRASALVARAEEELLALGAPVPERPTMGFDALSASERRIAAYAAEGFTVDEIAQSLFLTPATVEDYLSRARQTLGVQTDDEFARAVTARGGDATGAHVSAS
jgi:class 3 adenylate cyclase/tetratricopeptide (TPR) repeat protein